MMALKISENAVRCLYNYLRQLGYSVRKLKEVEQKAVEYVEKVISCIIGGHSLYGGESKTLIPIQNLKKLYVESSA